MQDTAAKRFFARLKQRTEEIVVGNPLDADTRLGPVINESQYKKVLGYIQVPHLPCPATEPISVLRSSQAAKCTSLTLGLLSQNDRAVERGMGVLITELTPRRHRTYPAEVPDRS